MEDMPPGLIVLSHYQAAPILQAHASGAAVLRVSLDLNRNQVEVALETTGVRFPDGQFLDWEQLRAIQEADVGCFVIEENEAHKIEAYSEETGRYYSLMPTELAPTMLLSGIPMHRIKGIDPHHDTLLKIKAIRPVVGQVLDTTMGLGYTAIEAARSAENVITIELDPAVLEIVRRNPWSQDLFENPKIERRIGDSFDLVQEFPNHSFSRIIHDPPAFSLAGDLYSLEFYRHLYRLLRNGGLLFHYIGNLDSPSGHRTARGAARRMEEAGFRVTQRPEAFGLLARK